METKWYSDIWQLMVAPFKRGIPQIVEHGSCRKGFYATAALALMSFVFSNILPALVGMIFVDKLNVALTGATALSGIGLLGLAVGLSLIHIYDSCRSVLVENKCGRYGALHRCSCSSCSTAIPRPGYSQGSTWLGSLFY